MNVHRVILFGQYQYQNEVSLHPSIIEMPVTIIAVGKFETEPAKPATPAAPAQKGAAAKKKKS